MLFKLVWTNDDKNNVSFSAAISLKENLVHDVYKHFSILYTRHALNLLIFSPYFPPLSIP